MLDTDFREFPFYNVLHKDMRKREDRYRPRAGFSLLQPLRFHAGDRVDADLPECRRARVDELVRRLGGDDDDISCGGLYRLLLDSEADCVATRGLQAESTTRSRGPVPRAAYPWEASRLG